MADTVDEDRDHLHSHGLRPGAQPRDGHVQQLRDQLLDHLDPGRRHHELTGSVPRSGGPLVITIGWVIVGVLRAARRHVDGRDLLGLPDGRRPLLLVGEAGTEERAAVELVHRLVQPHRPDRRDRQRGLRARRSSSCSSSACTRRRRSPASRRPRRTSSSIFLIMLVVARRAEHVRCRPGEDRSATSACGGTSSAWSSSSPCCSSRPISTRGIVPRSQLPEHHRLDRWHFSTLYVFFLGFLLAQYTITGFDASAHVSEETGGARTERAEGHRALDLHLGHRRAGDERGHDRSPLPKKARRSPTAPTPTVHRVRRRRRHVPRQRRTSAVSSALGSARPSCWCSSRSSVSTSAAWRRSRRTAA